MNVKKTPQDAWHIRKCSINVSQGDVKEEEGVSDMMTCLLRILKGNFHISLGGVREHARAVLGGTEGHSLHSSRWA